VALDIGICPKCGEYILLKGNVPFLICPKCVGEVSAKETVALLKKKCNDKDNVNEIIADCIALELQYGQELPFLVLAELADNFPLMEEPNFLVTRLSGYETGTVRVYLERFSGRKSDPRNVPWAEEFLDACLTYGNMEFADQFASYIENKIDSAKKQKYTNKLLELRKQYTARSANPKSTKLLFALYIVSSVLNVALLPLFLFTNFGGFEFLMNLVLAFVTIFIEVALLFWHNKTFGNRLGMGERERLLMVIFMSSWFVAMGASIIGSIYNL
jgi:hypothetical protein